MLLDQINSAGGGGSRSVGFGAERPKIRPAAELMCPEKLGVLQTSRLSATRLLMSKAIDQRWKIELLNWNIDKASKGTALYRIDTGGMVLDFIVHSRTPRKEGRIARIIGQAWDMMAALIEGPVSEADIEKTGIEIDKLYSGRATPGTLVWARSNRSGRAFDNTVNSLAAGRQPDIPALADACYLMRNTGLDGNGTFGTRSFRSLEPDHPLRRPLEAQMLCAYMMRVFSVDLAEHLARCKSPDAIRLDPEIVRFLGVGNGSALGLIHFFNSHPLYMHQFILAREQAIVAAKSLTVNPGDARLIQLIALLQKASRFRREDRMTYEHYASSREISDDLDAITAEVVAFSETGQVGGNSPRYPLSAIAEVVEGRVHDEALETYHGMLTELVPEVCDALAENLSVDEEYVTDPSMSLGNFRDILKTQFAWAYDIDLKAPGARKYIWYKSVTAEEPRRGAVDEVGDVFNLGLDIPGLVQAIDADIKIRDARQTVAEFLAEHPHYRFLVARIQTLAGYEYHAFHANILGEDFVPSTITRFINIGVHGLDKTRDYLDRNLRGVIYQGAPTVEDLKTGASPDWFYPAEPQND